jgi:hypothetical protein
MIHFAGMATVTQIAHWFNHDDVRLFSFISWPGARESARLLAHDGFYYFGLGTVVGCITCGALVEASDHLSARDHHLLKNPRCRTIRVDCPMGEHVVQLTISGPQITEPTMIQRLESLNQFEGKELLASNGFMWGNNRLECVYCKFYCSSGDTAIAEHQASSKHCIFNNTDPAIL